MLFFDFLLLLFVFLIFFPNVFFPSNCVVFDWAILGFWWDIQYKHISISNCRKLSKNRGIARFQEIKLHVIYQTFQNISINLEAQNGKAFWSISYFVQQVFIALINIILSDENPGTIKYKKIHKQSVWITISSDMISCPYIIC